MSALPLFDQLFAGKPIARPTAKELRDSGIKSVIEHTPDEYRERFEAAVMGMTSPFTSESIVEKVGMPPNHRNAVGALMQALAKKKVIKKTGRYTQAERLLSHSRVIAEWVRS